MVTVGGVCAGLAPGKVVKLGSIRSLGPPPPDPLTLPPFLLIPLPPPSLPPLRSGSPLMVPRWLPSASSGEKFPLSTRFRSPRVKSPWYRRVIGSDVLPQPSLRPGVSTTNRPGLGHRLLLGPGGDPGNQGCSVRQAGKVLVCGSPNPVFVENCHWSRSGPLWSGGRTGSALSRQGEGWLCVELLTHLG